MSLSFVVSFGCFIHPFHCIGQQIFKRSGRMIGIIPSLFGASLTISAFIFPWAFVPAYNYSRKVGLLCCSFPLTALCIGQLSIFVLLVPAGIARDDIIVGYGKLKFLSSVLPQPAIDKPFNPCFRATSCICANASLSMPF